MQLDAEGLTLQLDLILDNEVLALGVNWLLEDVGDGVVGSLVLSNCPSC